MHAAAGVQMHRPNGKKKSTRPLPPEKEKFVKTHLCKYSKKKIKL